MPKRYSSYDLIRIVTNDRWSFVKTKVSHHKYKHPDKPGIVVIPHPVKIMPPGTASSILKTAGIQKPGKEK